MTNFIKRIQANFLMTTLNKLKHLLNLLNIAQTFDDYIEFNNQTYFLYQNEHKLPLIFVIDTFDMTWRVFFFDKKDNRYNPCDYYPKDYQFPNNHFILGLIHSRISLFGFELNDMENIGLIKRRNSKLIQELINLLIELQKSEEFIKDILDEDQDYQRLYIN
jgi:hypothetical protein